MIRERAARAILLLTGLLFAAATYGVVLGILRPSPTNYGETMMMSVYATLGVFLLLAVRNPAQHRSLILFAVWSSFAHAATMLCQAAFVSNGRSEFLLASALFIAIGALLVIAVPSRQAVAKASPVAV